jgi:hypothetical protein
VIAPPVWLMPPAAVLNATLPAPALTADASVSVFAALTETLPPAVAMPLTVKPGTGVAGVPGIAPTSPTVRAVLLVNCRLPPPVMFAPNVPTAFPAWFSVTVPLVSTPSAPTVSGAACVMPPLPARSTSVSQPAGGVIAPVTVTDPAPSVLPTRSEPVVIWSTAAWSRP